MDENEKRERREGKRLIQLEARDKVRPNGTRKEYVRCNYFILLGEDKIY